MALNMSTMRAAPADGQIPPDPGPATPTPRIAALCLVVLTAIALLLRMLHLTSRSFTLDEGFSLFMARTNSAEFIHTIWNGELNMALYYATLRLWLHLSVSEFATRILSVAFGAATVAVVYFLGIRLFGRRVAIVAALIMALHPAHVSLSQDARSYSLTLLLVSLSSLLLLRTLQQPSLFNWSGYAIVTALAVYSHFFAVLVIIAQVFALLFPAVDNRKWNFLLKAVLLLAVLLTPIAIFLARTPRLGLTWVPALSSRRIFDLLYFLTLSKCRCLTYLVLWAAAIWAVISRRHDRAVAWPYWFVLSWLFVPVALTIAASVLRPLLVERFLAICIPASVLLAAAGFDYLLEHLRWVGAVTLLLLVLYSARSVRFLYRHPDINDDWRGATAYVLANARPNDEVVVLPSYARFTVDYYYDIAGARAPNVRMTSVVPVESASRLPETVWFLSSNFPKPGFGESQVEAFLKTHDAYCADPPGYFTRVKVWRALRCRPDSIAAPPARLNPGLSSPAGK